MSASGGYGGQASYSQTAGYSAPASSSYPAVGTGKIFHRKCVLIWCAIIRVNCRTVCFQLMRNRIYHVNGKCCLRVKAAGIWLNLTVLELANQNVLKTVPQQLLRYSYPFCAPFEIALT
jgi:hypothetical protein